jgi:hypothetical protein
VSLIVGYPFSRAIRSACISRLLPIPTCYAHDKHLRHRHKNQDRRNRTCAAASSSLPTATTRPYTCSSRISAVRSNFCFVLFCFVKKERNNPIKSIGRVGFRASIKSVHTITFACVLRLLPRERRRWRPRWATAAVAETRTAPFNRRQQQQQHNNNDTKMQSQSSALSIASRRISHRLLGVLVAATESFINRYVVETTPHANKQEIK